MSESFRLVLLSLLLAAVISLMPGCNHKVVRQPDLQPDSPMLPLQAKWPVEPPGNPPENP